MGAETQKLQAEVAHLSQTRVSLNVRIDTGIDTLVERPWASRQEAETILASWARTRAREVS
jgi:hypothetical protein